MKSYLPEELWGHIHLFLNLDEFCWPCKIEYRIRRYVTFSVRLNSAKPLYNFRNLYKGCVVTDCTASRGAQLARGAEFFYCNHHARWYLNYPPMELDKWRAIRSLRA